MPGSRPARRVGGARGLACRAVSAPPRQRRRCAPGPGVRAGGGGGPADGGAGGVAPAAGACGGGLGDGVAETRSVCGWVRDAAGPSGADRLRPAADRGAGLRARPGVPVRGHLGPFAAGVCPGVHPWAAAGMAGGDRGGVPPLRRAAGRAAARPRFGPGQAPRRGDAGGGVQRPPARLCPVLGRAAGGVRAVSRARQGQGWAGRGLRQAQRHRRAPLRVLGGEAARGDLPLRETLALLCRAEVSHREGRRIQMGTSRKPPCGFAGTARFPHQRTLEGFDFTAQPSLDPKRCATSRPAGGRPMATPC